MEPQGDWEQVASGPQLVIDVLQAALETAEIPTVTLGETLGRIYALGAVELGEVRLLVPPDRAEEARALLEDSKPLNFPEGD